MKKVLYTFSAALLMLVGCTKFAEDEPIKFDTATAPAITVSVVDDHTVSVTVAGAANTGFYSFAFASGAAKTVSASSLLSNPGGFSISDDVAGVVNFAAKPDTTFTVGELKPNSAYTVYAVAASKMGVVSDVASQSVTTTDSTIPAMKSLVDDDIASKNVVGITFDEPVSLSTGAGSVVLHYFAENAYAADGSLIEISSVSVPLDKVSVSGNTVSIEIPEDPIPGAIVLITMGEGLVENEVGLKSAAFSDCSAEWSSDGKLEVEGFGFQYDKEPFDFSLPMIEDESGAEVRMPADTVIYFSDWEELVMSVVAQGLVTPEINQVVPASEESGVRVRSTSASDRRVSYPATKVLPANDTTVVIGLDEAPDYGSYVGFTVSEGAFQDIWGNENNEFTTIFVDEESEAEILGNYFCSYGYKMSDLFGTYSLVATSKYVPSFSEPKVVIAPCTDPDALEAGFNVVAYDLFKSQPCTNDLDAYEPHDYTEFYGKFNIHSGELVFNGASVGIGAFDYYGWQGQVVILNESDKVVPFVMQQRGRLDLTSELLVYLNGLGAWDYIYTATMTKTSDDYTFEIPEDGTDDASPKVFKASKPANYVELRKRND